MKKSRKRRGWTPQKSDLRPPPLPPDVDLRDVPIPADAFIEIAMSQFGISREEASKLVHEAIARHHGAKGNA